jgi:hypothetical protein
MKWPKDTEHLVRLGGVFAAGVILFLVARSLIVPHSFGQYGHFRGDALAEVAVRFAGGTFTDDATLLVIAAI